MAEHPNDLLHGSVDVLILKALTLGPQHGYAIARWVEDRAKGVLALEDAALYKALHRLEDRGAIESDWGTAESGRRAKYYQLTKRGREQLRAETQVWNQYVQAVGRVLKSSET